jgi:hypothetical protein
MLPDELSPEQRQVTDEYYKLFGDNCPLSCVGFARVLEAISSKTPIPESEYEKYFEDGAYPPTSCDARTPEGEKAIAEYEKRFNEECPILYVEESRITEALAANVPIPESEYSDMIGMV